MKMLFISQPMRGKTDEQIKAERAEAVRVATALMGEEIEVLDTFFTDFNGKPLEFIGKSIMMLAQADCVYFAPGWEEARGCKIEHTCATEYGIDRIE